jgi:hypothetical protein
MIYDIIPRDIRLNGCPCSSFLGSGLGGPACFVQVIFWLGWLALLGAVIGLTIVAPRCKEAPSPAWWQQSSLYQVYLRSFYDNNGDGIGDIQGEAEDCQLFHYIWTSLQVETPK